MRRALRVLGVAHLSTIVVGAAALAAMLLGRDPVWRFDVPRALDEIAFDLAIYGPICAAVGATAGQRYRALRWLSLRRDRRLLVMTAGVSVLCVTMVFAIASLAVAVTAAVDTGAPLTMTGGLRAVFGIALAAVAGFHLFGFAIGSRVDGRFAPGLVAGAAFGATILAIYIGLEYMVRFGRLTGGAQPSPLSHGARTAFACTLIVGGWLAIARPGRSSVSARSLAAFAMPAVLAVGLLPLRPLGSTLVASPAPEACTGEAPRICVEEIGERYLPVLGRWAAHPLVQGFYDEATTLPYFRARPVHLGRPYYTFDPDELRDGRNSEPALRRMAYHMILEGLPPFCRRSTRDSYQSLVQDPDLRARLQLLKAFAQAVTLVQPPAMFDLVARSTTSPDPMTEGLVRTAPPGASISLEDGRSVAWLGQLVSAFPGCMG